ncbi:MAG TPA: serine/threonine-protein kinase [Pyrinomonadaceae bacterium]|jgi:serine/threonine-protein kinase
MKSKALVFVGLTLILYNLIEGIYMDDTTSIQQTLRQDPLLGTILDGRYKIISLIGHGGMGKIFLGEQLSTGRKVAVKIMQAFDLEEDNQAVRFFKQEIRALAKLNHHNIAQIYDASTSGDIFYIAIEHIKGETLRDRLNLHRRLTVEEALHILRETCSGLDAAHHMDIIHRDIKPENIMLTSDIDGSIHTKILDFGIAILERSSALSNPTGAGEFAGTPAYMSPEQVMSEKLTPLTDIYSLGVVGYELLTGVNPFAASRSPYQIAMNHVTLIPPTMRDFLPEIPIHIEEVIMRAIEKNPHNRFSTAKEFANAL